MLHNGSRAAQDTWKKRPHAPSEHLRTAKSCGELPNSPHTTQRMRPMSHSGQNQGALGSRAALPGVACCSPSWPSGGLMHLGDVQAGFRVKRVSGFRGGVEEGV